MNETVIFTYFTRVFGVGAMVLIYLLLLLISVIYLSLKYVFSHWKRRGVPYIEPTLLFGNLGPVAMQRISVGALFRKLYEQSSDAVVGMYIFTRPALLVRDAEIVKRVLSTDFAHFQDRGVANGDPVTDPVAESIFGMKAHQWKAIRNRISPSFSSGKLRAMIPTVLPIGEKLCSKFGLSADNSEAIEIKELCVR